MAILRNGRVLVSKGFGEIREQGFGELKKGGLELAMFEALYLLEKGKLEILRGKKKLEFRELLKEFKKKEKRIHEIYAVFKDLRTAGHVARGAKLKTPCFRVYARGARPGEEPSRFLLWILEPRRKHSLEELGGMVEQAHAVRKRALFAQVSKDTITYFKIDTTKF